MCSRRHQAFKVMRYTSNPFFRQKELKKRTGLEGLNPKKQEKEIYTQKANMQPQRNSRKKTSLQATKSKTIYTPIPTKGRVIHSQTGGRKPPLCSERQRGADTSDRRRAFRSETDKREIFLFLKDKRAKLNSFKFWHITIYLLFESEGVEK